MEDKSFLFIFQQTAALDLLIENLISNGINSRLCHTTDCAENAIDSEKFNLIAMDVEIPAKYPSQNNGKEYWQNGLQILKAAADTCNKSTPIILTVRPQIYMSEILDQREDALPYGRLLKKIKKQLPHILNGNDIERLYRPNEEQLRKTLLGYVK